MVMSSLEQGARTIVEQCMDIQNDEEVLVVNDSNDQDLIDALMAVLNENTDKAELMEYEEPETSGMEPPEEVAERMKQVDAVIAPTNKSISHTNAREAACENGAKVATLPTINKEVWQQALLADFDRVAEITDTVYDLMKDVDEIRVKTPSGTDVTLSIVNEALHKDKGTIGPGDFSNLPAGEVFTSPVNMNGRMVIDNLPVEGSGTEVEIKNNEVVAIDGEECEFTRGLNSNECARKMAEFGFGTNPEADPIDNVLQDEKALGTVHFAFGDNTFILPEDAEGQNPCGIHWDNVCLNPTVWFDGRKVLDEGGPVFLD